MSAKRVTISISDALDGRAEKWKDKYRPSELYQKALEDLVQKQEELAERAKGAPDMEQIIERLRIQKKEAEIDHFENGKAEGLAWAQKADYSELKYAAISFDPFGNRSLKEMIEGCISQWAPPTRDPEAAHDVRHICADTILGEYFHKTLDKRNYLRQHDLLPKKNYMYLTHEGKGFVEGWREAVRAFWAEVSPKLNG